MTIILIRHGKTIANEQHLYCGSTDLSLSEAGRNALQGKTVEVPENCRYFSSGMKRANETLELLFGPVPYEICRELREVDFGSFEMKSYDQLKEDPAYIAWITGDNMEEPERDNRYDNKRQQQNADFFHEVPHGLPLVMNRSPAGISFPPDRLLYSSYCARHIAVH